MKEEENKFKFVFCEAQLSRAYIRHPTITPIMPRQNTVHGALTH